MKKFSIIVGVWLILLATFVSINAKSELYYQIHYDSKTTQTYEMKSKILEIYRDLIEGIQKESYMLMLAHNKERFLYKDDMQVTWEGATLIIVEGDGEGDIIDGILSASSICVPEVKPRSFIAELFQ